MFKITLWLYFLFTFTNFSSFTQYTTFIFYERKLYAYQSSWQLQQNLIEFDKLLNGMVFWNKVLLLTPTKEETRHCEMYIFVLWFCWDKLLEVTFNRKPKQECKTSNFWFIHRLGLDTLDQKLFCEISYIIKNLFTTGRHKTYQSFFSHYVFQINLKGSFTIYVEFYILKGTLEFWRYTPICYS